MDRVKKRFGQRRIVANLSHSLIYHIYQIHIEDNIALYHTRGFLLKTIVSLMSLSDYMTLQLIVHMMTSLWDINTDECNPISGISDTTMWVHKSQIHEKSNSHRARIWRFQIAFGGCIVRDRILRKSSGPNWRISFTQTSSLQPVLSCSRGLSKIHILGLH